MTWAQTRSFPWAAICPPESSIKKIIISRHQIWIFMKHYTSPNMTQQLIIDNIYLINFFHSRLLFGDFGNRNIWQESRSFRCEQSGAKQSTILNIFHTITTASTWKKKSELLHKKSRNRKSKNINITSHQCAAGESLNAGCVWWILWPKLQSQHFLTIIRHI